jgi:hypothetical protein
MKEISRSALSLALAPTSASFETQSISGHRFAFRFPSHPRPAVIGDFDNLIQLKVGSKSEGSLVLVP